MQGEGLTFSWRAGDGNEGRIWGRWPLFRELAHERDETMGTRRGCVYGVGVAGDDEVNCSGHFGAKSPMDDARLACRLLGGVEKQADVVPPALCECGDAGIGELPRGMNLGCRLVLRQSFSWVTVDDHFWVRTRRGLMGTQSMGSWRTAFGRARTVNWGQTKDGSLGETETGGGRGQESAGSPGWCCGR